MALRKYQSSIALGTLYEVKKLMRWGSEQLQPSLEVIGGEVTLYGAQTLPGAAPTGMDGTNVLVTGVAPFKTIPNYIYVVQTSGTVTSLVLSGLSATAV